MLNPTDKKETCKTTKARKTTNSSFLRGGTQWETKQLGDDQENNGQFGMIPVWFILILVLLVWSYDSPGSWVNPVFVASRSAVFAALHDTCSILHGGGLMAIKSLRLTFGPSSSTSDLRLWAPDLLHFRPQTSSDILRPKSLGSLWI